MSDEKGQQLLACQYCESWSPHSTSQQACCQMYCRRQEKVSFSVCWCRSQGFNIWHALQMLWSWSLHCCWQEQVEHCTLIMMMMIITIIIIIITLSSSWRARYEQDKSCLSRAACALMLLICYKQLGPGTNKRNIAGQDNSRCATMCTEIDAWFCRWTSALLAPLTVRWLLLLGCFNLFDQLTHPLPLLKANMQGWACCQTG